MICCRVLVGIRGRWGRRGIDVLFFLAKSERCNRTVVFYGLVEVGGLYKYGKSWRMGAFCCVEPASAGVAAVGLVRCMVWLVWVN